MVDGLLQEYFVQQVEAGQVAGAYAESNRPLLRQLSLLYAEFLPLTFEVQQVFYLREKDIFQ
ncbi:hypothetical protein SDC9_190394 [bioreactor metagenome]|uniref:Uncharacterized protein n=1 Tax=bioreactor metagenome TaxID=1076179 RepID=A0A645HW77_9ZZZZ